MSETVIYPPTPGVLLTADLIEQSITSYLASLNAHVRLSGEYEAPVEALNLLTLGVRYLQTIVSCARTDLVTLPSAAILSRAVMEACARAMWLVWPTDALEKEARWLAHLRSEHFAYENAAKELEKLGLDSRLSRAEGELFREFADDVSKAFPAEIALLKKVPPLEQVLQSIGRKKEYVAYRELSQYAHATHAATRLYRRNLGNFKEIGEFIELHHWQLVFAVAWRAFADAVKLFFDRYERATNPFGPNLPAQIDAALQMMDLA